MIFYRPSCFFPGFKLCLGFAIKRLAEMQMIQNIPFSLSLQRPVWPYWSCFICPCFNSVFVGNEGKYFPASCQCNKYLLNSQGLQQEGLRKQKEEKEQIWRYCSMLWAELVRIWDRIFFCSWNKRSKQYLKTKASGKLKSMEFLKYKSKLKT